MYVRRLLSYPEVRQACLLESSDTTTLSTWPEVPTSPMHDAAVQALVPETSPTYSVPITALASPVLSDLMFVSPRVGMLGAMSPSFVVDFNWSPTDSSRFDRYCLQ
jgi:hypothetical protein